MRMNKDFVYRISSVVHTELDTSRLGEMDYMIDDVYGHGRKPKKNLKTPGLGGFSLILFLHKSALLESSFDG